MNMPVKIEYFKNPKNRELTQSQLDDLARELDAIKQEVLDDIGERDAKYIRRVYSTIRYASIARTCLFICRLVPASMGIRYRFTGFCQNYGKHGAGS